MQITENDEEVLLFLCPEVSCDQFLYAQLKSFTAALIFFFLFFFELSQLCVFGIFYFSLRVCFLVILMQLFSFIWQLLRHVQCDPLIFLALLFQPKHRRAVLIGVVNSNSSSPLSFLINCVINCSKKSEDNSSLKPLMEKERLHHLILRVLRHCSV